MYWNEKQRYANDEGEGMKLEERGELIDSFESGVMREIAASARRFSAARPSLQKVALSEY